jgi:uncharacterized membrane protein
MPKPRIQGLSDLIFGLALSIGAIQLVGSFPQTHAALVTDISAFGFSFLILINVWNRYTTTTSVMPVETPVLLRLNMVLLFLVALEPFLFNLLTNQSLSSSFASEVSDFYALDIAGMNLTLAYFTHVLTLEEKNLIPEDLRRHYRITRNLLFLGAAVFLISVLPIFWDVLILGYPVRIVLWILALPVIWGGRLFAYRA